jgi:hypothetical protein
MQLHLDEGDEVIQLVCHSEFDRCDYHMSQDPNMSDEEARSRCDFCIGRLKRVQKLVEGTRRVVRYRDLPGWRKVAPSPPHSFLNVEELQAFTWNGFDAGLGVAASLISLLRVTRPDTVAHRDTIERSLQTTIRLFASFRAFLARERPDVVYVFNGRLAHTRALFRACQHEGIRCLIHEMGSRPTHYALFDNTLPHDRDYFVRRVKAMWEERGRDPQVRRVAEQWYEERAGGVDQGWFSYVKHHDASLLPEGWDTSRPKIVVFTSSEDEFASIGPEWKNELFPRQIDGLKLLCRYVREVRPGADVVVRIHPNLATVNDPEVDKVRALASEGVIIVPPESRVSSYRLLHEADVVLSFGSTMGLEAVFWGKPSILLGPCMYAQLGGTYIPENVDELRRLLSRDLPPLDREPALMYAYFASTYGERYRYYEPTGVLRGRYRGVDLDAADPTARRFRNRLRIRSRLRGAARVLGGAAVAATILRGLRALTRPRANSGADGNGTRSE